MVDGLPVPLLPSADQRRHCGASARVAQKPLQGKQSAVTGLRLRPAKLPVTAAKNRISSTCFPANHFVFSFGRCVVTKFLPVGMGSPGLTRARHLNFGARPSGARGTRGSHNFRKTEGKITPVRNIRTALQFRPERLVMETIRSLLLGTAGSLIAAVIILFAGTWICKNFSASS